MARNWRALINSRLKGFLSPMSVVAVVLLFISSRIIIISVATGLVLPPIVRLIHCCHLSKQPFILILKLSDHSIQLFHSEMLRDIVHLVPIMLLVLVVMLIVLVVVNILSHVHTLTPYGDYSICVGVVFSPMVGANVLTYFSEVIQHYPL